MSSPVSVDDYSYNGYKTVVVAAVLIMMLSIMVLGRLLARNLQKAALATDDYLLLLATALCFGVCALAIAVPRIGGVGAFPGQSTYYASSTLKSTEQIFMAWMVLYGLAVAVSKLAILFLYTRVFTTRNPTFTSISFLIGFIVVGVCIANTFGTIFQCRPVSYVWDKSVPGGTCVDFVAFERYSAIPNVITGFIMLVMPIPLIWRLNVSNAAKVALTATFLHGAIGLISSAARLGRLFESQSTSVNDAAIEWTIWTINEPVNYVIAACLPTLRPIFVRILPTKFFVLSKKRTTRPYTSSRKGSSGQGSSRKSFFGLVLTDPRITGPWASRHAADDDEKTQDREPVVSRGELVSCGGNEEVPEDVEKGHYLVTKTVEIGPREQV